MVGHVAHIAVVAERKPMAQSLRIVGQGIGLGNAARIEPNALRFGFYLVRCNHHRLFFQQPFNRFWQIVGI